MDILDVHAPLNYRLIRLNQLPHMDPELRKAANKKSQLDNKEKLISK